MTVTSVDSHFAIPIMMCLLEDKGMQFPLSSTYSIIGMLPSVNKMKSG